MNDLALHPRRLNGISLCSGGGGLDRALELAVEGACPILLVEGEAFAVASLVAQIEAGLMAPAAVWSDVRTVSGRRFRGLVDFLIGGIPCQPHSLAGRRQGSLDERDLWPPARRIIVQARPYLVVIENVGGFLSAGADEVPGAARVRRDLRKLGFRCTIVIVRASDMGLPHERERVFIVAINDRMADRYGQHGDRPRNERKGGRPQPSDRSHHDPNGAQPPADGRDHRQERGLPEGEGGADDGSSVSGGGRPTLRPPGPGESVAWQAIADTAPDLLPALSRYDRFRLAMGDAGLAPHGDPSSGAWLDAQTGERVGKARLSAATQSAVRGMAHVLAPRIDQLRLLGNGVADAQGALAIRTGIHDLAAEGSSGAVELVRMMGEQP